MVGALSVTPLFSFPFYGHLVSELFITTHGFLSLSPRLHDYIYKTQYIAPLRIKVIMMMIMMVMMMMMHDYIYKTQYIAPLRIKVNTF